MDFNLDLGNNIGSSLAELLDDWDDTFPITDRDRDRNQNLGQKSTGSDLTDSESDESINRHIPTLKRLRNGNSNSKNSALIRDSGNDTSRGTRSFSSEHSQVQSNKISTYDSLCYNSNYNSDEKSETNEFGFDIETSDISEYHKPMPTRVLSGSSSNSTTTCYLDKTFQAEEESEYVNVKNLVASIVQPPKNTSKSFLEQQKYDNISVPGLPNKPALPNKSKADSKLEIENNRKAIQLGRAPAKLPRSVKLRQKAKISKKVSSSSAGSSSSSKNSTGNLSNQVGKRYSRYIEEPKLGPKSKKEVQLSRNFSLSKSKSLAILDQKMVNKNKKKTKASKCKSNANIAEDSSGHGSDLPEGDITKTRKLKISISNFLEGVLRSSSKKKARVKNEKIKSRRNSEKYLNSDFNNFNNSSACIPIKQSLASSRDCIKITNSRKDISLNLDNYEEEKSLKKTTAVRSKSNSRQDLLSNLQDGLKELENYEFDSETLKFGTLSKNFKNPDQHTTLKRKEKEIYPDPPDIPLPVPPKIGALHKSHGDAETNRERESYLAQQLEDLQIVTKNVNELLENQKQKEKEKERESAIFINPEQRKFDVWLPMLPKIPPKPFTRTPIMANSPSGRSSIDGNSNYDTCIKLNGSVPARLAQPAGSENFAKYHAPIDHKKLTPPVSVSAGKVNFNKVLLNNMCNPPYYGSESQHNFGYDSRQRKTSSASSFMGKLREADERTSYSFFSFSCFSAFILLKAADPLRTSETLA